jgi:hypothetical protein
MRLANELDKGIIRVAATTPTTASLATIDD